MPAGVPSGYNSKGDFFKGITSQMRANEKSSSPGYPGNQTSVAKKLSQLKDQEKSVLQFKPLSSMKVDASDVSAFVQKLDTEKSKVGVNDQHYDNNDVPKMSLVPEKEINTNNADYTSNVGDELISKEGGIQYQEIGHGAGYVEPIKPINAEKDAASAVFMSNYNDDQVFQPNLNEALNNEILNTTTEDIKETVIKAEDLKTAEVQNSIEILSNRAEIERQNNLKANKLLGLSDDNAPYVQDKEKGTYETDNMTVYRPREIEFEKEAEIKVAEIKRKIQAEKDLELSNRQSFQDSMMNAQDQVRDGVVEAGSLEVPITSTNAINEERLQASLKKQEEGFVDVIAGTTKVDMERTIGELAAERTEKERLAELHNQQINSTTADDIADVKPSNAVAQQTEILAANLQDNKEKAVKVDKPSKSQIEKKYPPFKTLGNGDGSLHGKDPFRFTTLEYPTNITSDEQYGHFILFYVNVQNKTKYKYIGYNDDGNVKIVGDVVEKQTYTQSRIGADSGDYLGSVTTTTQPTSGDYTTRYYTENNAGAEEVAYQKAQTYSLEGGTKNILQSNQVTLQRQRPATQGIGSRMDLTSRITDSVALYLPSEIGNSTSTKYQGAELGMLGYLALGGADLLGQLQNRDFAGMGDTAVGMIDAAITEGLKKSAVTAADLFSGASTQGSIDKVFGQTVNPFIEVAFESMGVRSFEYTFNFTPKSKEETEEVKAIIQLFRFHMVPELKGTNHRYLTLPSTFDIHYMYQSSPEVTKENTYYNKIATCVLEDCNVNYAPTGIKSFDDGAPTQITMTLRFMETEMLTKEKVNKGF